MRIGALGPCPVGEVRAVMGQDTYKADFLLELYRKLFTIRVFETRCVKLYREGLIRGYFHPYLGEEAVAVGVCAALREQDYIVSTHRGHGHCIAQGAELDRMAAELLGRRDGYCLGLGGSMHIADPALGNLGANGIVGGGIAIGVGAALGASIRDEDRVAAIFFSDGAANNGVFPEALNLAAVWNLPAIFVLENNHYAVCTPVEYSCRSEDLSMIGQGYSVKSVIADGNDVLRMYETTSEAVETCRQGKGPVLIEAKTYRHGGHHVNDPGAYMPQERLDHFRALDPLTVARQQALESKTVSGQDLETVEREVEQTIEAAVEFAKQSPELSEDEFLAMIADY